MCVGGWVWGGGGRGVGRFKIVQRRTDGISILQGVRNGLNRFRRIAKYQTVFEKSYFWAGATDLSTCKHPDGVDRNPPRSLAATVYLFNLIKSLAWHFASHSEKWALSLTKLAFYTFQRCEFKAQ